MISTKEITPQSAIDVNSLFLLGAFGKTRAPFYFWGICLYRKRGTGVGEVFERRFLLDELFILHLV
jgi:hypothetical protein